jgi:hypothetical protein
MLKGNKGEWSELFVFFKLLAEGKLFSADQNLTRTEEFVDVKAVFRNEVGDLVKYEPHQTTGNVNITELTGDIHTSYTIPLTEARSLAARLLNKISVGASSEQLSQLEADLSRWKVNQVSAKSQNKGDINLLIYDPVHGVQSKQEYSVKSFLGSDPTLFNANPTTNIIYSVTDSNGNPISDDHLEVVNGIVDGHKYIKRVAKLDELGYSVKYHDYQGETFKLNLQMIDSDLPEIIAFIVKKKYTDKITWITNVIQCLNEENPMGYNLTNHNFYEYRIINFLIESALGMTSTVPWSGIHQVVGGLIIVKQDSEVLCYHIIDFNKFKTYLKSSTRLDNPSGGKMGYGEVYKDESGDSFIKLNFQVKA